VAATVSWKASESASSGRSSRSRIPAQGVGGGRRPLGEESQNGEPGHDGGAHQRRQRPHQQQIEGADPQHQQQAGPPGEKSAEEPDRPRHQGHVHAGDGEEMIDARHPQPPLPVQRELAGIAQDQGAGEGLALAVAPAGGSRGAVGLLDPPAKSAGEAGDPAGRLFDREELAALDPQPPGPGRHGDAVGEAGRAAEVAPDAQRRSESGRSLLRIGEVDDDFQARRSDAVALTQPQHANRSGPAVVVGSPVAGDPDHGLHRALPVQARGGVRGEPEPHGGDEQAQAEEGQAGGGGTPQGEGEQGQGRQERHGQVGELKGEPRTGGEARGRQEHGSGANVHTL
jgi:hypothetical protein